jgi:single-strand DNA-binding protein
MDINKVMLVGRLTRDPDFIEKGDYKLARFSIATNRFYKKDNEKKSEVEFHNIVAWNKLAEIVKEYVKKGNVIYVEGRLETNKYTNKDGEEKETKQVLAEVVQFIN